ncbi:OLC1v1019049C1 [Oldenlandia corymbosa var. corymbosa]|uniref:OLC1v1019049C1 n=1 Tax=Oldenlandia corymbosa var. corymbosa TaxID=529605 RepID=A0AAV1ED69_OLDCO|nr:OLC1v1019049C1 [Oldenlandia corymbosa var. corymbosa]
MEFISKRLGVLLLTICFTTSMIIPSKVTALLNQSTVHILPLGHHPDHQEICEEMKCSKNGPPVRFPFRLQGRQPENCGYNSGYDLYCDESNRTIFQLPATSIKFLVAKIDYLTQTMKVRAPAEEDCMAKHLKDFDISTTPFRFSDSSSSEKDRYSLFNCSASKGNPFTRRYNFYNKYQDICLDSSGYKVFALPASSEIGCLPLEYCTKMYNTKLVSDELFNVKGKKKSMSLTWSLMDCKSCEMNGDLCGRDISGANNNQIRCFQKNTGRLTKIFSGIGPILGFLLLLLVTTVFALAYSKRKIEEENQRRIKNFLENYAAMKPTRYSYADIKKMTDDFKEQLGEGGYGNVFKGKVGNGIFVEVKLLHNSTENGEEFINEVGTMGKLHHANVVRLLGYCADGFKRALVYEFLPNGSLDKYIFPNKGTEKAVHQHKQQLGMEKLLDIAIGIARGIEYLHQGCEQRILHFDIKPQNILLDRNYNPKISDFGLAKLCEKGRSAVSMTAARGTMGYIAPEVFSRHFGNVTHKSDIYSLGILLLEMVGRRKNIDPNVENVSQVNFPEWVYGCMSEGKEWRIQVEEDDAEDKIAKRLAIVGLWCIQWNPKDRPSITLVLQMLGGSGEDLSIPPNPFSSGNATSPGYRKIDDIYDALKAGIDSDHRIQINSSTENLRDVLRKLM